MTHIVPPPTGRPYLLSVTGTNGKTSVTTFTHQLLAGIGRTVSSYTSFGVRHPDDSVTPVEIVRSPEFLPAMIAAEAARGAEAMALESFSGALAVGLYERVEVDTAICTGIESDHLDFHKTPEEYRAAKLRLFESVLRPDGLAIVPAKGAQCDAVVAAAATRGIRVARLGRDGDFHLKLGRIDGETMRGILVVDGEELGPVTFPFPDRIAVANALLSARAVLACGGEPDAVRAAIGGLEAPEGRLELVGRFDDITVLVDSAHNPGALRTALQACRDRKPNRLVVVFGAGGERDRQKRPVMGQVAARFADVAILTDDNPRRENPARIRAEVRKGAPRAIEIPRRIDAIHAALRIARPGDVVLLAGKGDEATQDIAGTEYPHDDRKVAKAIIATLVG